MVRQLFLLQKHDIVMYCGRTLHQIEHPGLAVTITINNRQDLTLMLSSASEEEVEKHMKMIVSRYQKYAVPSTAWTIKNGIHWVGPAHNWNCDHVAPHLLIPVQQAFFLCTGP